MLKPPKASPAQARELARLFSGATVHVCENAAPTTKVLADRGWSEPTGDIGMYPNGTAYSVHRVSEAGEKALLAALLARRHARLAR